MAASTTPQDVNLHDSKQFALRSLFVAMLVIPTVVVFIRFWSRYLLPPATTARTRSRIWWDDWTVLVALLFNMTECGMALKIIQLGVGLHIQTVPPENLVPMFKLLWIEYYIFNTGTAVAKSSALFFYARVFGVANSRFKYALWTVHVLNVAWLIGILFSVLFECSPIQKAWISTLPGKCMATDTLWIADGITSLLIDVIILILPLPMLWKLQMKIRRKILIVAVFVCGYLVVVVSIGRLVSVVRAAPGIEVDPSYNLSVPVLWLGSELAISITSVSLPSLFFLAQRVYREGLFSILTTSSHSKIGRGYTTTTDKLNTNSHSHDDVTELVHTSFDSTNKSTENWSGAYSQVTAPGTAARYQWANDHHGVTQPAGIHVRRDVMVDEPSYERNRY